MILSFTKEVPKVKAAQDSPIHGYRTGAKELGVGSRPLPLIVLDPYPECEGLVCGWPYSVQWLLHVLYRERLTNESTGARSLESMSLSAVQREHPQ